MSMTNFIKRVRALFGTFEDSSGTVEGEVRQLFRKHIVYNWPVANKAAAVANPATRMEAQTASLSASQPLGERVVYQAYKPCVVREIFFSQVVSSTTTATYTMAWTLQVLKRGGTIGTVSSSNTYSVTTFVGGLSSVTAAAGAHSFSHSYTGLVNNKTFAPNRVRIAKENPTKLQLKRGQVLTAKVRKGSGAANDSGALFRGGSLEIIVEEE